ncbi:hypothetical protein Ddc_21106 [Ditylenchus destructor]|nr:hypothetical protein Ddc_21106 [Ditylenchus destructor]
MRPYLGLNVRVNLTFIYIAKDSTYNKKHIAEMESIAHLWRDADISIEHVKYVYSRAVANNFKFILNSPTILQCRDLSMNNAYFPFKDYKVLYAVKVIIIDYDDGEVDCIHARHF